MTTKSKKRDPRNDYVPVDYEDLYRYYILGAGKQKSLCQQLIHKMTKGNASPDEREELAQDVFLRIIETDQLKVFDPSKANFGGVIFYVTRSIVANWVARKERNPIGNLSVGSIVESSGKEESEFEPGVYSLDFMFGQAAPDHASRMDAKELVDKLVVWAKDLASRPKSKRDESLLPLLGLLLEERDTFEMAERLGVTQSTIFNWMRVIRDKAMEFRASVKPA